MVIYSQNDNQKRYSPDYKYNGLMACALFFYSASSLATTVSIHKNEDSGLLTWTAEDNGFSLELIQLLPDFIRAVYEKHNFSKHEIERIASYCVFGTILKNTSAQTLRYSVSDWRYRTEDGNKQPVKTKTQWLNEWLKAGISFSWTLLPDMGEFEVGDWQQGFTTVLLDRDDKFDLIYTWQLDDVVHTGVLKDLKCAPAVLPATE